MTTAWELAPINPQVGPETPLLILDREDGLKDTLFEIASAAL